MLRQDESVVTRVEAARAEAVVKGLLDAWAELSAEMGGTRVARWDIVNEGLCAGERYLAELRAEQAKPEITLPEGA